MRKNVGVNFFSHSLKAIAFLLYLLLSHEKLSRSLGNFFSLAMPQIVDALAGFGVYNGDV